MSLGLRLLDKLVRRVFPNKVELPDPTLLPDGVEVREATSFLDIFRRGNRVTVGMTIANTILVRKGPLTLRLLKHELTHVTQWHKYGIFMLFLWIWELFRYKGADHDKYGLEGEAEAEERKYPNTVIVVVE